MTVRSPHDFLRFLGYKTSYGDRKETARAESEIVGTPHRHCTGSIRFPLKVCGYPTIYIQFPYDLCMTVPTQNVDGSQSKKSFDVHIQLRSVIDIPLQYSEIN